MYINFYAKHPSRPARVKASNSLSFLLKAPVPGSDLERVGLSQWVFQPRPRESPSMG